MHRAISNPLTLKAKHALYTSGRKVLTEKYESEIGLTLCRYRKKEDEYDLNARGPKYLEYCRMCVGSRRPPGVELHSGRTRFISVSQRDLEMGVLVGFVSLMAFLVKCCFECIPIKCRTENFMEKDSISACANMMMWWKCCRPRDTFLRNRRTWSRDLGRPIHISARAGRSGSVATWKP